MSFLALRFISAFCNFNPITFLPVCFPQGRPDIGDHVSVLLLNTAEAGAELGAKVSTACLGLDREVALQRVSMAANTTPRHS